MKRVTTTPDLRQLQGNILRGYGSSYRAVRHVVLRIADPVRARAAVAAMLSGERRAPQITTGDVFPRKADLAWALNLGITFHGFAALGLPESTLATFPREFRLGMAARAPRIGDVGRGDPARWTGAFSDAERVHVIITITGRSRADIEPVSRQVTDLEGHGAWEELSAALDGEAFELTDGGVARGAPPDGGARRGRLVHFGYLDGIAQPRFDGLHDREAYPDHEFTPFGAILLGYPTGHPNLRWPVPQPHVLGFNGSFSAFRVLRQDVRAFEDFLDRAGRETGQDKELVAAKLCGRWRDGVPLVLAPTRSGAIPGPADPVGRKDLPDHSHKRALNDFGYLSADPDGLRCPVGAHIRRANPRDADILPRAAGNTRRVIRRGMSFGPAYRPEAPDDIPRGLLGNFICADLASQFEALQGDWLNLGLLNPSITGTNDPLVGANDELHSAVTWPTSTQPVVLRQLPQFVHAEGGAYCFLPSIPALHWLAAAGWRPCAAPDDK